MTVSFKDAVGRTITVGTRVAYASYFTRMTIGTVIKTGTNRVKVQPLNPDENSRTEFFNPADVVRV